MSSLELLANNAQLRSALTCARKTLHNLEQADGCPHRFEVMAAESICEQSLAETPTVSVEAIRSAERTACLQGVMALMEFQRRELNGNPLTDGRYQGLSRAAAFIRERDATAVTIG